jgi:hypothetical protein
MSERLYTLGPKVAHDSLRSLWHRDVTRHDGRVFRVGIYRGRAARGMYGVKGWRWYGWVQDRETYERLWEGRVEKSAGARSLLILAGVVSDDRGALEAASHE